MNMLATLLTKIKRTIMPKKTPCKQDSTPLSQDSINSIRDWQKQAKTAYLRGSLPLIQKWFSSLQKPLQKHGLKVKLGKSDYACFYRQLIRDAIAHFSRVEDSDLAETIDSAQKSCVKTGLDACVVQAYEEKMSVKSKISSSEEGGFFEVSLHFPHSEEEPQTRYVAKCFSDKKTFESSLAGELLIRDSESETEGGFKRFLSADRRNYIITTEYLPGRRLEDLFLCDTPPSDLDKILIITNAMKAWLAKERKGIKDLFETSVPKKSYTEEILNYVLVKYKKRGASFTRFFEQDDCFFDLSSLCEEDHSVQQFANLFKKYIGTPLTKDFKVFQHGDLHLGNVLMTCSEKSSQQRPQGSAQEKEYQFIDFEFSKMGYGTVHKDLVELMKKTKLEDDSRTKVLRVIWDYLQEVNTSAQAREQIGDFNSFQYNHSRAVFSEELCSAIKYATAAALKKKKLDQERLLEMANTSYTSAINTINKLPIPTEEKENFKNSLRELNKERYHFKELNMSNEKVNPDDCASIENLGITAFGKMHYSVSARKIRRIKTLAINTLVVAILSIFGPGAFYVASLCSSDYNSLMKKLAEYKLSRFESYYSAPIAPTRRKK